MGSTPAPDESFLGGYFSGRGWEGLVPGEDDDERDGYEEHKSGDGKGFGAEAREKRAADQADSDVPGRDHGRLGDVGDGIGHGCVTPE